MDKELIIAVAIAWDDDNMPVDEWRVIDQRMLPVVGSHSGRRLVDGVESRDDSVDTLPVDRQP